MSAELAVPGKEGKTALEKVEVFRVQEDYLCLKDLLADHYFRSWRNEGLCESLGEAKRRLDNYYDQGIFESSFAVSDPQKEVIYSLLLTTNVKADSLFDLLLKIPKYRFFENRVPGKDRGQLGFSVCFSITAESRHCIKNNDGSERSLSRFSLFEYKAPDGFYKTAYSRLTGVGRKNIHRYYIENVANPRNLGATGMHESAYGGATLAILKGSRPEDALGGGSNFFILLPRDETQRAINAQIMEGRRRGFVPFEKIGPILLFSDIWPYLSLAR